MKMIIGLTGTFGAGKGTVAEMLKKKGFGYHSCSDYLRKELKKQGKKATIPNLAELGNSIREKSGSGEIARRLLKTIDEEDAIVDSLRHPEEIKVLKENSEKFFLIAVDAPVGLRYERAKKRGRIGDNVSFEEFKEQEKEQMKGTGGKMQLGRCMEMADYRIINDSSIEELNKKIEEVLKI